MALFELRKFVAPEFIFGVGARHRVGDYTQNMRARRALIVTDPGVIAAGWLQDLQNDLDAAEIEYTVYQGVTPNPRDHEVMTGVDLFRRTGSQIVIALGGGSVIDCAKGIVVVAANGRHILDFEGVDNIPLPGPPLICIPTTAGTSADISQFAIITDVKRRNKIAIISKTVVPDIALVDPQTTTTMDPYLTACTGLDVLTHAIEAHVSTASSPLVDGHALSAIQGVKKHLLNAVINPHDLAAREQMMLASLQAGLAFSNASLGANHAMAHSLGGYLDLAHGECNALLLGPVIDFNFQAAEEKYLNIGNALGLDMQNGTAAQKLLRIRDDIQALRVDSGVERGLADRGVTFSELPELARHAVHDACIYTNPRKASSEDLKAVYEEAL